MAQGDATSSDVPGRYDVVIDGKGYILLQSLEPSLPFRTHRAVYSSSPTFVERSNVSNAYGDNAQDFFLTVRQRDWSLGEQQKYYRAGQDGRYWMGSGVDVSTPGQVRLSQTLAQVSFAASVSACAIDRLDDGAYTASSTTLYSIIQTGTITSKGAHGLGAAPSRFGMASDGENVFLSTTSGGTVGVRKWDGASFTTFSTSGADSLAFLNNTLYGYRSDTKQLVQWDSSGNQTNLFQWKDADGGAAAQQSVPRLHSFGGKLLVAHSYSQESSELWIYDGAGVSRLETFPENFIINDVDVLYGVAYIGGSFIRHVSGGTSYVARPSVLFFDGSQIGKLWEANDYNTSTLTNAVIGPHPALAISDGRLLFLDESTGNLMAYNPELGGVSSIGSYTPNVGDSCVMTSTISMVLHTRNQSTAYLYPSGSYPQSGYVISSLIDFDNSLPKQFRGVKVEFDAASDGNGGSVDIAYQVDSLTGAWTTLQSGATSGVEYSLTSVSGHSIAFKITLNKGTSTSGPTLKAMSVRGAPQLTTYKERTYILDLSGIGRTDSGARLADGTEHPLAGHQQAENLFTAITKTTPITVSDRFISRQTSLNGSTTTDSFTAMCVPADCEIYDVREGWDNPQYPGGYVAKITVREV